MRTSKIAITLAIAAFFLTAAAWAQAQAPAAQAQAPATKWKDGEYPLYDAALKQTDNLKKIDALKAWEQKFPDSAYKDTRLGLFMIAYEATNQFDKVLQTGNEILASNPKDLATIFRMATEGQRIPNPSAEQLGLVEKAAKALATNLDDLKPATVADAAWSKEKPNLEALGHATLGWVAEQRKDLPAAEKAYSQSLGVNPANGAASYRLAEVMRQEKDPDKNAAMLFEYARAAFYTGTGALTDAGRKEIEKYITQAYTKFHGSAEGFDELRKLAATQALPPADLKILSKAEVDLRKEEEFKKSNPMMALWLTAVKTPLIAADGNDYFEKNVKGSLLPGGAEGVSKFKGKLVDAVPAKNPKQLKIALGDSESPEVTLVFEEPLTGTAPKGTDLEFEGVASSFTTTPFNVTFEVEKDKLVGWPVQAGTKKGAPGGAAKPKPPAAPAKPPAKKP